MKRNETRNDQIKRENKEENMISWKVELLFAVESNWPSIQFRCEYVATGIPGGEVKTHHEFSFYES
jgi:hypothetical protein